MGRPKWKYRNGNTKWEDQIKKRSKWKEKMRKPRRNDQKGKIII